MSDTPETIAEILAEIRKSANDSYAEKTAKRLEDHDATGTRDALDIKDAIQCLRDDDKYLLDLADRIEAAAKRMRDSYCELCQEKDAAYDRLLLERDRAVQAAAPGNAAALREALEAARREAKDSYDGGEYLGEGADPGFLRIIAIIDSALSAPARNCDRYEDSDAAVAAFRREMRPGNPNIDLYHVIDWLFAPAEGGAE